MGEPQERSRLKFKKILFHGGPLMPQGYRLATVEEIRSNKQILETKEIPVKKINPFYDERSGDIRLLDGWVTDNFSTVNETPNFNCVWNAVVKKQTWVSGEQKWKNCADLYSSGGNSLRKEMYKGVNNSLRKEMYKGVNTTSQRIDTAWFQAYCYEDVEALYWLWLEFPYSFDPALFTRELQTEHIHLDIDHGIPLREMVMKYENRGNTRSHELDMTNPSQETQAVLRYAIDRSRDGLEWTYLYGPTWAVATVEFAIEIHGQTFVKEANKIVFVNAEAIPITTKFLSLLSPDGLQTQIDNLQLPVPEILIEAVKRGYTDLGEHLLNHDRYALPDKVGEEEKSLFHYALPHKQVFSLLKDKYVNSFDNIITREDTLGRNVLHWAAKRRYASDIVKRLLERPVSRERERLIYSKDHQSRTPWHVAAFKEDIGMIEELLRYLGVVDCSTRTDYIQATDSFGQTALHIAASEGHSELVKILINGGSCPLKERDGQRKTALHHAARVKIPEAALATCKALVEHDRLSPSERSLLLWASATGIGTADEMEDVHKQVQKYLQTKKNEYREPLLRAAAINDNVEIAWELLSRGADIADICDQDWTDSLQSLEKECVQNVLSHLEHIKEQGRDQPSMEDKLGRYVFAQGLAALFLNRFIESPITVGIFGEWGMGKSSLMFQTEKILLITAAQLTFPNLLPREQFFGFKNTSLSARGKKIYQQINRGVHNLLGLSRDESKEQNPLVTLLKEYQTRYHDVYKALACMDNNQMLKLNSRQEEQAHAFKRVPRILTIQYNAWHYRDEHEAWAGLGVTISKEIEKAMTRAQWMSTCWRYTWGKHKASIWIQVFLPCLLSIFLAGWVCWIVWMLLKQEKFHGLKYGSIPLTIIPIVWVVLKSVTSVIKPVSTQMLGYITVPNHKSHLGYQEGVINDINFLKKELGKQPHWFFSFILWCWNWFGLYVDNVKNTSIPKCMPASGHDIRIVAFVDDLDRCEEKVVLKVLSAINLVLTECKINVILGMDKKMIERAIGKNFEGADNDVAEKFISKIIQIPLSLPDPTVEDSNSFLEYHLRHKIPAEYIEKKSVSQSQRGLVLSMESREEVNDVVSEGGNGDAVLHVSLEEFEQSNREINDAAREGKNGDAVLDVSLEEFKQSNREINDASREGENGDAVLHVSLEELEQSNRGIIERALDWWKKLGQPYNEDLNSLRSAEGVRLIREILLPNYTSKEADLFYKLKNSTTGNQKLPREWKCLLNYHKFGWYVLSLIGNVYCLPTWREEFVVWVFVCWQWKNEMNHLIKVWNTISIDQDNGRNKRHFHGPSLYQLVTKLDDQGKSQMKFSKIKEALIIQDVSMEGVQLFQQFRFHCEIDRLPWPSVHTQIDKTKLFATRLANMPPRRQNLRSQACPCQRRDGADDGLLTDQFLNDTFGIDTQGQSVGEPSSDPSAPFFVPSTSPEFFTGPSTFTMDSEHRHHMSYVQLMTSDTPHLRQSIDHGVTAAMASSQPFTKGLITPDRPRAFEVDLQSDYLMARELEKSLDKRRSECVRRTPSSPPSPSTRGQKTSRDLFPSPRGKEKI